jgi:MFS family permease
MTTIGPEGSSPGDGASAAAAPAAADSSRHLATIAEPTTLGMSLQYLRGRPLRTYAILYALALGALSIIWSGLSGVVLPNHIQDLAFAASFPGADGSVDLQQLSELKAAIAAGTQTATNEQTRLLTSLQQFETARATVSGVVSAVSVILIALIQPIVGVLSDRTRSRFGRRAPWILFGAVTGAALTVLAPLAPTLAVLAVLWIAVSLAFNVAQGPLNTTLADRIPEENRGRMSSAGGIGNFVGGTIGAVAASLLYPILGYGVYVLYAVVVVIFFTMFVVILRDRSSVDMEVRKTGFRRTLAGFVVPLKHRDFLWVWISRICLLFGYTVSSALSFFMMQSYIHPALSQTEATAIIPYLALSSLPATMVAIAVVGRISDRVGRRKPFIMAAGLLMAVAMIVPLLSPTLPALFVQTILTGLAFGIYLPVDQALFVEVLPDRLNSAGRDLGVAAIATNIGQALGPILAAQVVAITGSYQLVWPLAAVLAGLAAFTILPVKGAR